MLGKWSREWPTEDGFYWYYGHSFDLKIVPTKALPLLNLVRIYRSEHCNHDLICIYEGCPHYKQFCKDGQPWGIFLHQKVETPELPPKATSLCLQKKENSNKVISGGR